MEEASMRVLADGRVKRSEAEWRKLFEKCEASGLSALAFCQRAGIPRSTFTRWQQRVQVVSSQAQTAAFVELPLPVAGSSASLAPGEFELSLPGGVTLRWKR
jgi:hypothetical protein